MSWNEYKNVPRKVGRRLRISCLPSNITTLAPAGDEISSIRIESREHGRAMLQIWSYTPGTRRLGSLYIEENRFNRYTVTVVSVPEDPEWIVEGDD